MLAEFDERAPTYDRENPFFDEDFEELRDSGYLLATVPAEMGGGGLGLDEYVKLAQPARLPRPGHRAGREHALLLDRRRRRPAPGRRRLVRLLLERPRARRGLRRPPRRGRQRPPAAAVVEPPSGSTAAGRSPATRSSAASRPVWTLGGFHAMDTSDPAAADRPRLLPRDTQGLADRRHVGHARHAGHAEPGHRARTASSCPTTDRAGVPGRVRRRRACSRCRSSPGRSSASRPCTSAPPSGPSTSPSSKAPQRTSVALTSSMAHHPEVQHHVADMRIALRRRRGAARAHRDRLGHRRRARRLAGAPRRHPPVRHQPDASTIVDRALDLCGRVGVVQAQPARAALPRRRAWAASTPATRCSPTS